MGQVVSDQGWPGRSELYSGLTYSTSYLITSYVYHRYNYGQVNNVVTPMPIVNIILMIFSGYKSLKLCTLGILHHILKQITAKYVEMTPLGFH